MSPVDTIELRLDDRPHRVPHGTTLGALVQQLGHAPRDVGTALNGRFVARAQRDTCELHPGDSVLLFQPIVGG